MAVRPKLSAAIVDLQDPHGKVSCDGCERLGKPPSGVHTRREGSAVHLRFELPAGWALTRQAELLCTKCASGRLMLTH